MTLAASGPIGIGTGTANRDIKVEFGIANGTSFPAAYYGKGGAPASGPLSFADFYGRTNGFTVNAAPSSLSGGTSTPTANTSGSSTATPSGGSGSFTYSWVQVSGDAIFAVTPSAASTIFRGTGMVQGENRDAAFKCTVTDTVSTIVVDSNLVNVTLSRL